MLPLLRTLVRPLKLPPYQQPLHKQLAPAGRQHKVMSSPKKMTRKRKKNRCPVALSVMGFKFSGDFRFRTDMQARSGNDIVPGPVQNVRSRYRARLNVDKDLDPKFNVPFAGLHWSLNVGTTNDQDMAGTVVRSAFSLAEAYVDYHPNKTIFDSWWPNGRGLRGYNEVSLG